MFDRKTVAVLGVVTLVLFTGCLHGGSNGDVEPGEEATVAVAVGLTTQAQEELSTAQQEAQQEVIDELNESETALYQEAQQAQLTGQELNESHQELLDRMRQQVQEAQSQAEAEAEESRQQTLSDVEETISSSDGLELSDRITIQQQTFFLVTGEPNEIVGLLGQPGVHAIVTEEQFSQLQQQQQQQQQGVPGGAVPGNETGE